MQLLLNEAIYREILLKRIPEAREFLWIATADLKDLHVEKGRRFVPFLEILSDLIERGVSVRLLHAKEPGPRFRKDFDRYPHLVESELFERVLCPRLHSKIILADAQWAFVGSANMTGAGLGAKSPTRRNFEAGFVSEERPHIASLMEFIDELYLGNFCLNCGRREHCPDPIA